MSDERPPGDHLSEVIARAIEEFHAARGGGMTMAYALVVDYIDAEGERSWATAYADRQVPAATLGVLRFATISVEEQTRAYLRRADDDDE